MPGFVIAADAHDLAAESMLLTVLGDTPFVRRILDDEQFPDPVLAIRHAHNKGVDLTRELPNIIGSRTRESLTADNLTTIIRTHLRTRPSAFPPALVAGLVLPHTRRPRAAQGVPRQPLKSAPGGDRQLAATSRDRKLAVDMQWWTMHSPSNPRPDDWFIEAVERVAEAGRQACLAIDAAVSALRVGCEARNGGRPIVDIVDELIVAGGREIRLGAAEAFREYERAIASMRADVVRALVDEGGLSLTDAAKRLKISRQAAARLYEPGSDGPKVSAEQNQESLTHPPGAN